MLAGEDASLDYSNEGYERTMGPVPLLLPLLTGAIFQDAEAMAGTIPSGGCSAAIDLRSFSVVEIDHVVGYSGGSQYFKTGMAIPEPIPIGLLFDDDDRVLFRCGLSCVEEAFDSGAFNARWTLESPGGLYPGAFIAADGVPVSEHIGAYSRDFGLSSRFSGSADVNGARGGARCPSSRGR